MTNPQHVDPDHGFAHGAIFLAAPDAVVVMDAAGMVRDWNPAAEALFGYSRAEAVGAELAQLIIPPALRDVHRSALRRHIETGETRMLGRRVDLPALHRDRSELAVELSVARVPDSDPPQFLGFLRSRESREASERHSSRLQQRMSFLAEAGLVLDRSLDYDETLRAVANLTVPDLAHMTVIDLLDERRGFIELTVAAGRHPDQARAVEATRRATPLPVSSHHPVGQVLRTGTPLLLEEMDTGFLAAIAQSPAHAELMHRLEYRSAIVVPLVARGRTLGTVSLLRMADGVPYAEDDLVLAVELARRAGLAVDNARLYESARDLARTLQESLLPPTLPEIPGLRLAGRYRAAGQGHEVGGDFYDVFSAGEGRWAMTIGDVVGKGAAAAALTGLARYTIRAFARASPEQVLRRLNDAVMHDRDVIQDRLMTALFATAVVRDGTATLEIAAGGHPPPLVLRAGGEVEQVPAAGPLIGLSERADFPVARLALGAGDMLVLYTDGLTDAQAPQRILSEADLGVLLTAGHGRGAASLAAFLEECATEGRAGRDDIALLVAEVAG